MVSPSSRRSPVVEVLVHKLSPDLGHYHLFDIDAFGSVLQTSATIPYDIAVVITFTYDSCCPINGNKEQK